MADKEKKTAETAAQDKPAKKKDDKPSFFQRAIAWLKTVRAECKKVTWASWESVRQNSIVVIVTTIVFAVFLGILDYAFNSAILGLSRLF
jgi:preprotein translocase subunit SecE